MSSFKEIRRRDRAVEEDEAREILARAGTGVLATVGSDGWPYAVPVNHVLDRDALYIHCAVTGHKLENIAHEARVCYCAVASSEWRPEEMSMMYESAVVFGRADVVSDPAEKLRALELLAARFYGAVTPEAKKSIDDEGRRTSVVRIQIDRITGKAHRV